jgi:hypothetical protein
MLTLLLAASAAAAAQPDAMTAIDAEYAFARDAQRVGQWTAFRKWADRDAVMFTPQAIWAHEFLNGRKDPPHSVNWAPDRSLTSCDGGTSVTTGPWVAVVGPAQGYFTTVWQRDGREWRWVYDAGDELPAARPAVSPPVRIRASCSGRPAGAPLRKPVPAAVRAGPVPPPDYGIGESADRTLGWEWQVQADGARQLRVFVWNGSRYEQMLVDRVAAKR